VTAVDLLAEFHRLGISLGVRNGMIVARPKGATPPKLREAVRAMKAELLRTLPEARDDGEPLDIAGTALLARLKGYTLPSGRIAVIRELAERMRGLADTTAILPALRDFERELIDLGDEYDAELTDAMEIVQSTFPGARLVKFTQ
jgi:tubulysin polyketide synthase-like protein